MLIFIFLGIVSSIFQLTIFREFTYSLAKNELSFILGVGIWLIFASLGSRIGRRKKVLEPQLIPPLFCLVFSLVIVVIHLAKSLVGLACYEAASLGFVFTAAIFLVSPVSFLIGYSFSIFSRYYLNQQTPEPRILGKFFAYEAIGFFLGGIFFAFFLSAYSNPFIFGFLSLLFLLGLDREVKEKIFSSLIIILISVVFSLSFKAILKVELKGATIRSSHGSAYGSIILAEKFGVESLYLNGSLIATSEDKADNEAFIHSVLSASKRIKSVLFIGPYFSGQIQEILKYNIRTLDCLDINPVLSALSKAKLNSSQNGRVNFIIDDPRSYLNRTKKKYDCIIMNNPAPSNLAFNRYFSYQFFQLIARHLSDDGIFSFRIPSKVNILSPRIASFNSCIINTLEHAFRNRLLIPSDSMIIIASLNNPIIPSELIGNFKSSNIATDYFTIYQLKDSLDPGQIHYLESMLTASVDINSDFNPQGFLYYSLVEQAKFYPQFKVDTLMVRNLGVVLFVGLVLFIAGFGLPGRKLFLLNASVVGFSSIGLSAIIFVLFQATSGALFWKMGILVGLFMAGLSFGTLAVNLNLESIFKLKRPLPVFYLIWFLFLIIFTAGIKSLNQRFYLDFAFYISSFLSGTLTGSTYPLLSKLMFTDYAKPKNLAAAIYSADLAGAALGTFIFSFLFIPFLGIGLSLLMIMFLIFAWGLRVSFD